MCWGNGMTTPYTLSGMSDATAMAAGADHACALRSGGAVSCWGSNDEGQLGNGSYVPASRPEPVFRLSAGVAVSAGLYFACAVRSSGTVYCWGAGGSGQLGNGYPWSSRPLRVLWPVLD